MSTDAEWLDAALAEVEVALARSDRDLSLRVQAAVRLWVDATLFVDQAAHRDRFEQRLADAISTSRAHAWCDGDVTALDVARTLHTCARAARLHDARTGARADGVSAPHAS